MDNGIEYMNVTVCKADYKRLCKLDEKEQALKEKLDYCLTEDTPATRRFINTTFPNGKSAIENERQSILSKYTVNYEKQLKHRKKQITAVCLAIVLTLTAVFMGYIIRSRQLTVVYTNPDSGYYDLDQYCPRLSSTKYKLTLNEAGRRSLSPCIVCAEN